MFGKLSSSLRKYKSSILRQEDMLRTQSETLKRLESRLPGLDTGSRISNLPDDFDAAGYIALNPDLARADVSPTEHYMAIGAAEGRPYATNCYAQDGLVSGHNAGFRDEPAFRRAYERGVQATDGQDYNWHWRVHVALWAARTAIHLPGDFIECGVNRGFLSSAIMLDLDWNSLDRKFWLLDTFAGLDTTGVSSPESDPKAASLNERNIESGFYTTDVEIVRQNFAEWKNVEIVVGSVPATLDQVVSEQIAFASIDMNSAPPEIAAMEFLWPRLVPGALVVFDDYTYCGYEQQNAEISDFAAKHNVTVLSLPTGQGLLIKPALA